MRRRILTGAIGMVLALVVSVAATGGTITRAEADVKRSTHCTARAAWDLVGEDYSPDSRLKVWTVKSKKQPGTVAVCMRGWTDTDDGLVVRIQWGTPYGGDDQEVSRQLFTGDRASLMARIPVGSWVHVEILPDEGTPAWTGFSL